MDELLLDSVYNIQERFPNSKLFQQFSILDFESTIKDLAEPEPTIDYGMEKLSYFSAYLNFPLCKLS